MEVERIRQLKDALPRGAALHGGVAWKLATEWDVVQDGHMLVELCGDSATTMSVIPSHEWIRLTPRQYLDGTVEQARLEAGIQRAMCVTWALLSRCKGYGAEENPVFWKHAFDKLYQADGYRPDGPQFHAARFFRKNPFPSVEFACITRSSPETCAAYCRTFFGVDPLPEPVASTLDAIVSRLGPLLDPKRSNPVNIAILISGNGVQDYFYDELLNLPTKAQSIDGRSPQDVEFIFSDIIFDKFESPPSGVERLVRSLDVQVPFDEVVGTRDDDEGSFCCVHSYFRHVFALEGAKPLTRVHGLSLWADEFSDRIMAAICSALPQSQSICALLYRGRQVPAPERHWAWLGYALFHPDSPSSAWRRLLLHSAGNSHNLPEIWAEMARGNNLFAILNGDPTTATAYISATLRPHSSLFREANSESSAAWVTGDQECSLDACVASADMSSLQDWTVVILPGYGLLFTHRGNITQLTARPPSESCLTGFQGVPASRDDPLYWSLPQLLDLFSTSLECLDVGRFPPLQLPTLRRCLSRFPSLVSLSISDNGELWSGTVDEEMAVKLPQLRELMLWLGTDMDFVPFSQTAMKSSLRHLTALSITVSSSSYYNPSDLRDILIRIPELQYLYFEKEDNPNHLERFLRYTHSRRWSKQVIGLYLRNRAEFAARPLGLSSRYAFLLVVARMVSSESALGRLDRGLLTHVLGYAGDRLIRQICVIDEATY